MTKHQTIQESKEKLDELDQKINRLESEYENVKEDSKQEYQEKINKLKEKKEEWSNKLKAAGQVTDEGWDDIKDAFKESTELIKKEVNNTFDSIRSIFK